MSKHEFTHARHDVVRRTLRVIGKDQITPRMLRLRFESNDLVGFDSPSPDDHIKIFLPAQGNAPALMRDFTPRAWDIDAGTFELDFALHPRGPAIEWARSAEVGDHIDIAGPRGSSIAPNDFDWYMLIGDATSLPAMNRRLESLPPETPVDVMALVAGCEEEAYLDPRGNRRFTWLHATDSNERDLKMFRSALQGMKLPAGEGFIWIAAEVSLAKDIYRYMTETLGHPKAWIKAAGYWSSGRADGGERIA
jgi:NADPH-dependent ferric siderophore reductase